MSDFFQPGIISTIHRLGNRKLEDMERDLMAFSRTSPVGLVLPALYREFQHPAMQRIVDELRGATWLKRIVVAIGRCSHEEYRHARAFFDGYEVPVTSIWMEDPRVEGLLRDMHNLELTVGGPGKGQTCWLCFGYLLSQADTAIIALHDCDIRDYQRDLLARLVYPLAHPTLSFEFCKGYYARVSDNKLHGRVTRLFFTPLIRAVMDLTPENNYLRFLDSFRYALSGEFAMHADLARVNRIPSDWGLEVGTLAEVYRNASSSRVCQVDISENYEHKHQELSPEDASRGLRRMTVDIAKSLFRSVAQGGHVLTADHFRTLEVFYIRFAQDTIRRFYADAIVNGLDFDQHQEDTAVQVFANSIREAANDYLADPRGAPQIPNWNRVFSAMNDVQDRLRELANEP
ncbi:MAG: cell wall biogenesis glycosyltransferase [Bryobacter sp.]